MGGSFKVFGKIDRGWRINNLKYSTTVIRVIIKPWRVGTLGRKELSVISCRTYLNQGRWSIFSVFLCREQILYINSQRHHLGCLAQSCDLQASVCCFLAGTLNTGCYHNDFFFFLVNLCKYYSYFQTTCSLITMWILSLATNLTFLMRRSWPITYHFWRLFPWNSIIILYISFIMR